MNKLELQSDFVRDSTLGKYVLASRSRDKKAGNQSMRGRLGVILGNILCPVNGENVLGCVAYKNKIGYW